MMQKLLALVRRDAKIELSYPLPFAMQWVAIVVGVSAFYYVSKLVPPSRLLGSGGSKSTYFAYVVVNVAFMLLQTNAVQAFATNLRRDQMVHVVEPIFATPTPVALIAFGSGLWKMLLSAAQVLVYLGVATFAYKLDLHGTNVGLLALFTLLSLLCMSAIGVIGAGIVIYSKQQPPSNYVVGGAASMLAGVLFPVALLPFPLQIISWLLPITHALNGMRAAIAGASLQAVSGDAVWLAVASVVLMPISVLVFSRCVDRARSDGTLAHY